MALDTWMILGVYYLLVGYFVSGLICWVWARRSETTVIKAILLPMHTIGVATLLSVHDYNNQISVRRCRIAMALSWPFLFVEQAILLLYCIAWLIKGFGQFIVCTDYDDIISWSHRLMQVIRIKRKHTNA